MHSLALALVAVSLASGAAKAPGRGASGRGGAKQPAAASATQQPTPTTPAAAGTNAQGSGAAPAGGGAAASAPEPARAERTKVAVLELSGLGITDITKNLEQYLRNSIATIDGFQVLSSVDVQMALQDPKNRAVATCGGGVECAVRTAKLVGADVVIIGSITGLGEAFSLNLRAIDVKRAKELARHNASVSGRDKLIPEVRLAAYRLVAPDRIRGWLVLDIDVEGAEVEIDGKTVGTTPLGQPVDNLTPGQHVVVVKRPGYVPFQQKLAIRPFEPTKLTLTLAETQK